MSAYCNQCGQYHESLTVCPNWKAVAAPNPLPPSEKAELQVSLLNAIGLTLTAVAKEQVAQAERLKTYKLSLEGIQGLLVDLDAKLETLPDRDNMTNALHLVIEGHHKSLESVYSKLALIDMKAEHLCRRKPRKAGKRKGKKG